MLTLHTCAHRVERVTQAGHGGCAGSRESMRPGRASGPPAWDSPSLLPTTRRGWGWVCGGAWCLFPRLLRLCPPCQGELGAGGGRVPLLRPGSARPGGPRSPAACSPQPRGFTATIFIVSQGPVGQELGQGLVGWASAPCEVRRATTSVASSSSRVALRSWTGSAPWRLGGPTRIRVLRASVPTPGWGVRYLLWLPHPLKVWWPRT